MKKIIFTILISSCLLFTSCKVFNQIKEVANLANCEYTLKNVSNLSVAGVNLQKVAKQGISMSDISKLASAFISKDVPLTMNVNVNVANPTAQNAALTAMHWVMEIENTEFASGVNNKVYQIKAGKNTIIPLAVKTDVYSVFSERGLESLKSFVKSFSGDGTSSQVKLKVKPSLNVAGIEFTSPTYIKLEKKIGGSTTNSTTPQMQPRK